MAAVTFVSFFFPEFVRLKIGNLKIEKWKIQRVFFPPTGNSTDI
jgi:hypothetical protein